MTIFADVFNSIVTMTNLIQRTLSGIVYISIVISSIWFSPYAFLIVFAIITGMAIYEFHHITNNGREIAVNPVSAIIAGVLLFVCTFVQQIITVNFSLLFLYALFVIGVFIAQLFEKKSNPIYNWAYFILGQVFIALPFTLLNHILFIPRWCPVILLALFLTIWMNDSWAYVFGSWLGKHKMFERISPKKSWEGFVGGAVMSLLTGVLCWYVVPKIFPEIDLALWKWLLFSELIVIFGTFGDLMESLMKRTLHIKDSGNIIPGHGGMLDRFDSMLLSAPVIYIFIQLLG